MALREFTAVLRAALQGQDRVLRLRQHGVLAVQLRLPLLLPVTHVGDVRRKVEFVRLLAYFRFRAARAGADATAEHRVLQQEYNLRRLDLQSKLEFLQRRQLVAVADRQGVEIQLACRLRDHPFIAGGRDRSGDQAQAVEAQPGVVQGSSDLPDRVQGTGELRPQHHQRARGGAERVGRQRGVLTVARWRRGVEPDAGAGRRRGPGVARCCLVPGLAGLYGR